MFTLIVHEMLLRDMGERENDGGIVPMPVLKGGNRGRNAFSNQYHRQFHGL